MTPQVPQKSTAQQTSPGTIVTILEEQRLVERGGYTVPIYECGGRHYFQDSLSVDQIERDEEAQPRPYNEKAGEKIAASVQQKVIMQPILCRWSQEQQKFLVTEGQHRWRAFKDVLVPDGFSGAERIPAIVYIDVDKRTALQCGIEANAEDRARSLSGQEMARKAASILVTTRQDLAAETGRTPEQISEREIFDYLGKRKKSEEKKYLLGDMIEMFFNDEEAKIRPFLSDKSSKVNPITVKNFEFFLSRLTYLQALDADDEDLRPEQYRIVRRLTNLFVDEVLGSKWTPDNDESPIHKHARNIVRRHPFEALGYFMAKTLDRFGGNDASLGAAWARYDDVDWEKLESTLRDLLASHVWDERKTYTCRNLDELKMIVNGIMNI